MAVWRCGALLPSTLHAISAILRAHSSSSSSRIVACMRWHCCMRTSAVEHAPNVFRDFFSLTFVRLCRRPMQFTVRCSVQNDKGTTFAGGKTCTYQWSICVSLRQLIVDHNEFRVQFQLKMENTATNMEGSRKWKKKTWLTQAHQVFVVAFERLHQRYMCERTYTREAWPSVINKIQFGRVSEWWRQCYVPIVLYINSMDGISTREKSLFLVDVIQRSCPFHWQCLV